MAANCHPACLLRSVTQLARLGLQDHQRVLAVEAARSGSVLRKPRRGLADRRLGSLGQVPAALWWDVGAVSLRSPCCRRLPPLLPPPVPLAFSPVLQRRAMPSWTPRPPISFNTGLAAHAVSGWPARLHAGCPAPGAHADMHPSALGAGLPSWQHADHLNGWGLLWLGPPASVLQQPQEHAAVRLQVVDHPDEQGERRGFGWLGRSSKAGIAERVGWLGRSSKAGIAEWLGWLGRSSSWHCQGVG